MKQSDLDAVVEEIGSQLVEVADEMVEQMLDWIGQLPNPEQILNKPYEEWAMPQDPATLAQIPGYQERLNDFIFRKEWPRMRELLMKDERG